MQREDDRTFSEATVMKGRRKTAPCSPAAAVLRSQGATGKEGGSVIRGFGVSCLKTQA